MNQRVVRPAFLTALVVLCAMHTAQARVSVNLGIGVPGMFYAPPPPVVFVRPSPFWAPPVVYSRYGFSHWHRPPRFVGPRHAPHPGWRHPRRWH